MSENDHIERLKAMLEDDFGTWDLSSKDKDAIRWALNRIDTLNNEMKKLLELSKAVFLERTRHIG